MIDGRRLQSELDLKHLQQKLKCELVDQKQAANFEIINSEDFATGAKKLLGKRKRGSNSNAKRKFLVVDTVRKFKGLEAPAVFLILDKFGGDDFNYMAYCGMSRAISLLYVYYI